MKVKRESEVTQSCPTLSDPMDCSLPGSSIHGSFQARVLEWGAIAFSVCPMMYPYFPDGSTLNLRDFFTPGCFQLDMGHVPSSLVMFTLPWDNT